MKRRNDIEIERIKFVVIMEKETALKILRDRHANALFSERTALETLIPELAESEDESIKKDIIIVLEREATRCFKETGSMPQWYDRSIAWLEKQGEQKSNDKVELKFKVGDVMRTLQEAADGFTDGMPVVVSMDDEYYHCTNELIAIKNQDNYEYPPINRSKPIDKVEPKFNVGDWVVSKSGNLWRIDSFDEKHYRVSDINSEYFIPISKQDELQLYISSEAKRGGCDLQQELEKQDEQNLANSAKTCKDEQKPADKVEPKFKKGDVIRRKDGDGLEWTVEDVHKNGYYTIVNSDRDDFIYLDDNWEIINQKAEPKFKVGDWITNNYAVWCIERIHDGLYDLKDPRGSVVSNSNIKIVDNNSSLWTIQDAKDGDVLVSDYEGGICITILKSVVSCNEIEMYCHSVNSELFIAQSGFSNATWHPATKEQRDLLFQKMKEAGYEWDAEKKELKKVNE